MYSVNTISAATLDVVYDFDFPVIMNVADGLIAITRNFMAEFGYGSGNHVRVKIPRRRGM